MNTQKALIELEYTQNWLDFGILTEEFLIKQITEFEQGNDKNTEHFRHATFCKFIQENDFFSDLQIQNFITLAQQDNDNLMAGSALKNLYQCSNLTPLQFEKVEQALIDFGIWTAKLIEQNRFIKMLQTMPLTAELLAECITFKQKYQSNMLIQKIIEKTEDKAILEQFTTLEFGKTIRNLANQKLRKLEINANQKTRHEKIDNS